MSIKRRNFLIFLGASAGTVALGSLAMQRGTAMPFAQETASVGSGLSFTPVKVPMPLALSGMAQNKQMEDYQTYEVMDDLVLPEGFTYDVVAAWGDRVGDSRFGYNNDYLSFVETSPNEGYLTVNFEYISGKTWTQTYPMVIGGNLALKEVQEKGEIDAFSLAAGDELKAKVTAIAEEMMIDMGLGVIGIRREENGQWIRTYSQADRRITGISGLKDGKSLKSTGPAVTVFAKANKMGYEDGLKDQIIGTFANCAGGTSPWGTVFSAEENFQNQVYEGVMADGSSFPPSQHPFQIHEDDNHGCGNPVGLAGNKYGWMVEIDPANPNDYGTKHTWLGRYRHEAVGFFVRPDKKLAIYSGCDRRGGHLYKFISQGTVRNVQDKANSRLLNEGMLYGAKFNPDGTGQWIALRPETPVNPVLPSQVSGGMVPLPNPDRPAGDFVAVKDDADAIAFQQQFKTLGDLYLGTPEEKQGAILIDAHFAANAAGISCTARPEDTIVDQQGNLYIAFTSGNPGSDGGPDKAVFQGPNGDTNYEHGWVVKLQETGNDPAALTFRWQILALGGEPSTGGAGFSNPDNIEIDASGNVWMVTDMSTSSQNKALPSRIKDGKPVATKDLVGIFGNNALWYIPTSGANAGEAYPFALGPMECECTGPFFSRDQQTLFLAVQHPGEVHGVRMNGQSETRKFAMTTPEGTEFIQDRGIPLGSNWPSKQPNAAPKPAVVAIRRTNQGSIS